MTTNATFKEHRCDWSHQVSATWWSQRDQTLPLSAKGCGLRDYQISWWPCALHCHQYSITSSMEIWTGDLIMCSNVMLGRQNVDMFRTETQPLTHCTTWYPLMQWAISLHNRIRLLPHSKTIGPLCYQPTWLYIRVIVPCKLCIVSQAIPFAERKSLVMLQPSSCPHGRNLLWPIKSALFIDCICCHGVQLHHVFSGCQHLIT